MFGDVQTAAKLMVKVGADVEEAQRKLNGMSKEFDSLKAAGTKMAVGVTVAVAAVGAATVAFAAKAIAAGSDLEESQNKARVVFGQSAAAIEEWSKGSAQALAMTQQQALEASATFGNLFTSMGLAIQPATEMSKGLVQLAADLASFNNLNVDDALLKLQSGLVGETEPLRALGVNLSAATTQAEALKMGLAANVEALTAADLAQARYALILQQTTAAQGDLARTSDGWANQNRILQATLANITAEIGTKLLPVVTPYLQALTNYVATTGPQFVQQVTNAVATLGAMSEVMSRIQYQQLIDQTNALGQHTTTVWDHIAGAITNVAAIVNVTVGGMMDAIRLLGDGFTALKDVISGAMSWDEFKDQLAGLADQYVKVNDAFKDHMGEVIDNVGHYDEMVAGIAAVTTATADATEAWAGYDAAMHTTAGQMEETAAAAFSMADLWAQAHEAIQNTTTASMDSSRLKVLETFNGMAQDYARHAQAIVDLEQRKGEMVAYLESVYQQQAAALVAAGQTAQLGVLTQAHNAKLKSVLASYNTQISLEKTGQNALLSNAKNYYLTTLSMMAKALIAQVATVKANMTALVRMLVSGYGSAAAAAYAFNKIKEGVTDMAAISAAISEVQAAFNAIEGAGIAAITGASDAFKDWKAEIGGVADGIGAVGDGLDGIGTGTQAKLVDPLKAAATVVEGIGQMIEKAIAAFNTLAKWGGPDAGWVEKFDLLAEAIIVMVRKWADAVKQILPLLEDKKRNQIMQFAEMVRAVMSALQSAITIMGALEAYEGEFEIAAQAIDNIVGFVKEIVTRFEEMAKAFKEKAVTHLKLFAETALQVVKLIGDALVVFTMLQDLGDLSTITRTVLDQIVSLVHYIVKAVSVIADKFTTTILEETKRFTEGAGAVMKLIGDAVGSLMKLKEYDKDFSLADAGAQKLVDQIGAFVRKLVKLSGAFDADLLAEAKKFADVAGPVVTLIGNAIGSLMKFKEYDKNFSLADAGAQQLVDQIGAFVRKLVKLSGAFDADLLAEAKKFSDVAGPVVKLIGDAIGSLMKFKDYDKNFSLADAGAQKLVDQIGAFVRKLVRLSGAFDADLLAEAKKFSDVAGPVVKLIGDAIGSLMKFKDYDKNFSLANAGAQQLVDQIGAFVRKLARLGQSLNGDALTAARQFAATAGPVVEVIGNAIGSLMKFKDYDKDFNLQQAGAQKLVDQIGAFVRKLARLGQQIGQPAMASAVQFAEAAGKVVATIGDALDLLTKIKTYVSPSANALLAFERDVEDMLLRFTRWVVFVIQPIASDIESAAMQAMQEMLSGLQAALEVLNGLVDYVAPTAGQLTAFMDGVEQLANDFLAWAQTSGPQLFTEIPPEFLAAFREVFDGLGAAVDVLTALVDFVPPGIMAVMAFEEGYQRLFQDWVTWATVTFKDLNIELVQAIAGVFNDVMGGLQTAVDVLTALADFVPPGIMAVMAFEEGYQRLFQDWVTWATITFKDLNIELIQAIAGVFNDVMGGLRTAVDVLTALADFVAPSIMAVMAFEEGYQRLFQDWVTWATVTFAELDTELVTALAGVFNDVMGGLRTAVDVLTALVDFVAPSAAAVTQFEDGYEMLFQDWVTWATGAFAELDTELVAALAGVFGNVFTGIGAAVATLTALSDYVSPGETAITAFETDYQRLFTGFVTWVNTTFTDIGSDLVVAMAGAAASLFQGLGAAATTLTQITGYIGPTDQAITQFEADYQRIATDFANWAESSWTEEMAATTTAVGNAVTALFGGLGAAVTTLDQIRTYVPASQASINSFLTDMTEVMGRMLTWVQTSFGPAAQQIMTGFGNTAQTLFSAIGTALTVLAGIADYTISGSEFRQRLQRFNDDLYTAITSWQIWLTNIFTPETAALVQQFHTLMAGIVTDMRAALQLLMDIDQASLPTADELVAFLEAVAQLFEGVSAMLGTVAGQIGQMIVPLEAAFQALFGTLGAQMWAWGNYAAGMFLSGMLVGMQNINSVNAVVNAMRDLAEQLEEELRAAWGLHSPSRVAMGIGEMFVEGLARGLRDLADIPAMIQNELTLGGVSLGADVRFSPAPRHDRLTIEFQGAYQAGMSPAEEKRITQAMVGELRRQGVALQVARV